MRSIAPNLGFAATLAPAARTTSASGSTVDLQGFEGAAVVFQPGAITDGTHTPFVEESADASTWTTVAAGNLQGTLAALAANTVQKVGYRGTKRYVRGSVTVTGSPATGGVYGAVVVKGLARTMPVA